MSSSKKDRQAAHASAKAARHERLSKGVYGDVQKPSLLQGPCKAYDLPSITASSRTCKMLKAQQQDGIDRKLDWRCFYTGTNVYPASSDLLIFDPRQVPWMGSKDHLIPARRGAGDTFAHGKKPILVWSSFGVNSTLGLAPAPVRLTIRRWLSCDQRDPEDTSLEAGLRIRWKVIEYLDFFRINGRYPWSRKADGHYWDPKTSEPFMHHMQILEQRLLLAKDQELERMVSHFSWRF